MCEELGGNRMMLMDYIENYGNTILCSASEGTNCNEQELGFIEKYKSSDITTLQSQLERLNQMTGLNTELQHWVYRRIRILNQLLKQAKEEEESEGGASSSGEESQEGGGSAEL